MSLGAGALATAQQHVDTRDAASRRNPAHTRGFHELRSLRGGMVPQKSPVIGHDLSHYPEVVTRGEAEDAQRCSFKT